MNNAIIAVYGRSKEGKSTTAQNVCRLLISGFPTAPYANLITPGLAIDYTADILVTIQIGGIKIGIESQGDPYGRMFKTIEQLAKIEKCDIIICTTRTSGATVNEVDRVANIYSFHTIWISSFYSPTLNQSILNMQAAENILVVINMIMSGVL